MAYINGNLALQPERKPQQKTVIRETKKRVLKRKSLPIQEKLLYLFTVLICVIVAGVIIFRYAQIYDMNLQIKQMNTEYKSMHVELEELKRQVEMLNDPERIRQMAESQGMVSSLDKGISVKISEASIRTAMRE